MADVIELGLPFTDPIADGPTIQKSNTVCTCLADSYWTRCLQSLQKALLNNVTVTSTIEMVRDARKKGLKVPIIFMGYYNPILSYGEERLLKDCREAGINGFIVVDLPPEEAVTFRNFCAKGG